MGGVFLFNFTKLVFWIGRTCFLTRNSFKKNVLLDGSTQRWLRIPLVWILYILQGHRRTKEQWRRGWQVWPALNLLRLLCGLSAPNEALFLLLLKLNTVFDSSLPKPQWSFLKSSLWRRDSLSHGNHICSGSCHWGAASTRGGGGVFIPQCFCCLCQTPPCWLMLTTMFLNPCPQLLSPHLPGNRSQVFFLHQGMFTCTGGACSGQQSQRQCLFWKRCTASGIFPSSATRGITPNPSLLPAVFKKYPCSSVHLFSSGNRTLAQGIFFTQDLLMLFLFLF